MERFWLYDICVEILTKTTVDFTPDASGFGGLEAACWPLVPKFACSHPTQAVGFLGQKKSSARLPSEGK